MNALIYGKINGGRNHYRYVHIAHSFGSGLSYYVRKQIAAHRLEGIMVIVLVRHKVADFARWKQVFDGHFGIRHAAGELSCRMFHTHDNAADLTLFFEWETLEMARAFFASEPLKNGMQQAGVVGPPEILFLDEIRSLRRTAAD